jgi:hypothetical protein
MVGQVRQSQCPTCACRCRCLGHWDVVPIEAAVRKSVLIARGASMALTKKEWRAERRATIKSLREQGWEYEAIKNYLASWNLDWYRFSDWN